MQTRNDIEIPQWLAKHLNLGRLLFAFVILAFALFGCSEATASDWQSAQSILSEERIETIVQDNSSLSGEQLSQVVGNVLVFRPHEAIYFIDFNSRLLRGSNGRRFAAYRVRDGQWEQVFMAYLVDAPGGFNLIEATQSMQNGLPCLRVHQPNNNNPDTVKRLRLCFTGESYELVDRKNIPLQQEG